MSFLTEEQILDDVANAIIADAELELSPVLFDARNVPSTGCDRTFCLDLQSQNTGKYRGSSPAAVRAVHTLKVGVLFELAMHDQFTTLKAATNVGRLIINALSSPATFPALHVEWKRTERTVTQSREHLLVVQTFEVEHDLATA